MSRILLDVEIECCFDPKNDYLNLTSFADESDKLWVAAAESGQESSVCLNVEGALKLAEALAQFLRSQVKDVE